MRFNPLRRLQLRKPQPPRPPSMAEERVEAERVAMMIGAKIDKHSLIHFWMVPLLRKLCERIEALERKVGR